MANRIQIKRSLTSGNVPNANDLLVGEFAVNIPDKKIFTKNGADQVVKLNVTDYSELTGTPTLDKATVGLSNVDNTSDADKPVSTATQTALNTKQDALVSGTNIKTINGESVLGAGDLAISSSSSTLTIDNKTSAYTVVASDLGKIINCTSGTFTVSLTAAATLGVGFNCWIWNTSNTATDVITIDPNASETIDGKTTLNLRRGEGLQIVCDGTNWRTGDKKAMRGYSENLESLGSAYPVASGQNAIAIGLATTSSGAYSLSAGYNAIASAQGATAIGIGYTGNISASSNYSTALGLNSSAQGSQAVTGAGAMALGGSYASGTDSFAAAIANNTSSYGATGNNSVAVGQLAKASGASSYAVGNAASATANFSVVVGGDSNTASGPEAFVIGGESSTASAAHSGAFGSYAVAALTGKHAHSSGRFAAAGDAQYGRMVLRKHTTDATATVLTADTLTPGSTNQVILPDDSTYAFSILVVARRTDANDESAGYKFEGVIDRNSGAATTAIVGTVAKTVLAEDTVAWDCNVSADTTNGGLKIEVTGEAGKTIRWVATVWTTEVTG